MKPTDGADSGAIPALPTSLNLPSARAKKPVLVHYHIFKNAGSTIDFALQQSFGENFAFPHGNNFNAVLSNTQLLDFLASNPHIRAISSHHLRLPKPEAGDFAFHEIVILRHPIDRLLSTFEFYRRSSSFDDPLQAAAKDRDFGEFIHFLIAHFPHLVNNVQVNYLACAGNKIPREPDLKRAIRDLPQLSVVGTVELLDITLVAAEFSFLPVFGRLDLSYVPQNANPDRLPDLDSRLQRVRQLCGTELYERLLKLNKLDHELLNVAGREARTRFAALPHREEELANFIGRCRLRRQKLGFAANR